MRLAARLRAARVGGLFAALLVFLVLMLGPTPGPPGRAAPTVGEWDEGLGLVAEFGPTKMPVVGLVFPYVDIDIDCPGVGWRCGPDDKVPPELEKCALHADAELAERVGRCGGSRCSSKTECVISCQRFVETAAVVDAGSK